MIRASVENLGVEVGSGVVNEAAEEVFDELSLQIADQPHIVDESVSEFVETFAEALVIVLAVSFLSLLSGMKHSASALHERAGAEGQKRKGQGS